MMTEYPKFSVLMSFYIKERPEYLQASLNSLVNPAGSGYLKQPAAAVIKLSLPSRSNA